MNERFEVGDRVRIPQDGWEDTPHHDGTVTEVDGSRVFVVWDEGPHTSAFDRWFTPDSRWIRIGRSSDYDEGRPL